MRTLVRLGLGMPLVFIATACSGPRETSVSGVTGGAMSSGGAGAAPGSGGSGLLTGGQSGRSGGAGGGTGGSGVEPLGGATVAGFAGSTAGALGGSGGEPVSGAGGGVASGGTGGTTGGTGGTTGGTGGTTGGTGGDEPTGGWIEQWNAPTSQYLELWERGANIATPDLSDALAEDGKALELLLVAGASASPGGGVETESTQRYQYGVFSSRLRAADCAGQPSAGVVTGLFTYFNDGSDADGDGLPDNSEIDFEWLCAEPEVVYLTMWTDYRGSDDAHQRVTRSVNLRTGEIRQTCYGESFGGCQALTGDAAQPSSIPPISDYDSAARYYEYGFEWRADRVTWWMREDATATPTVLWDYRGPAVHIPTPAASFLANVWHTSNWPPPGEPGAVEPTSAPVSAWIDWMRYSP